MRVARSMATVVMAASVAACSSIGAGTSATPKLPSPTASSGSMPSPSTAPTEPESSASSPPSNNPTPRSSVAAPTATPGEPTRRPPPCCEETPVPPPSHAAGLEASDRFWNHWYDTCWFGAFDISSSVEEIADQSDVVVRGSISDLYSRGSGLWELAFVKVAVAEVLKGEPVTREAGTIEVYLSLGSWSDIEEMRSRLPRHDHLWFLVHESTRDPDGRFAAASKTYYATDDPQVSVIRDVGGTVQVIRAEAIANVFSRFQFPVPLDGTRFDTLVKSVRQAVASTATAKFSSARLSPPDRGDRNHSYAC